MFMKLSIIIPLYNAEKYIGRCLDSLLCQSIVSDMEIVVVDDHGQDNSVGVVIGIRNNHPLGNRIKLIATKRNGGAWAARNRGMENSAGEWIGFVDADDYCEPEMYSMLISAAEKFDADFGYCLAWKEYSNGKSKVLKQPATTSGYLDAETKGRHLTQGSACFWTGVYRRRFLELHHIRFPKSKFSEDSYFWYKTLMYSSKIAVVEKTCYHYIIHPNSVSKRPDPTKARQKEAVYRLLLSEFKESGIYGSHQPELEYMYIKKGFLIPLIITAINGNTPDFGLYFKSLEDLGINPSSNKYYCQDLKSGVLYNMFKHRPKLISWILKKIYKYDPF